MKPFNISPSEALLIGCSVGEYREAKNDNEYADIFYFWSRRLRPFVPSLELATTTEVSEGDYDKNAIRWKSLGQDKQIGFLLIDPNFAVFYRKGNKITKTVWDCSRKSLLDLLSALVEEAAVPSPRCFRLFPPQGMKGVAHLLSLPWNNSDYWDVESLSEFQTPERPDDTEAVVRVLNELITDRQNGFATIYETGQAFGRLLAELERWNLGICQGWFAQQLSKPGRPRKVRYPPLQRLQDEGSTLFLDVEYRNGKYLWHPIAGNKARARLAKSIDHLLSRKVVQSCPHAEMSMRMKPTRVAYFGGPMSEEALNLQDVQNWASLAFGAVLGSMQTADDDAYRKDAACPTPRMFMLGPTASSERIKGQVSVTEQILCERANLGLQPEHVIIFSENVIEGLAKELWESEFTAGSRKGELRNILREHCQSQVENESRFARIALTLYDTYRKPAQHGVHTFQCTWEEARFFHIGTRILVELSEAIKARRTSS